jgi:hypothetical protein
MFELIACAAIVYVVVLMLNAHDDKRRREHKRKVWRAMGWDDPAD